MKKGRIILTITILILINFISAQSNPKPETSYSCDVWQGFNFQPDIQSHVGHVTSMIISDDTPLTPDLTVTDPEDRVSTVEVVGVLSDIYWEGGYADPIQMNFLISTNNKNLVTILTHTSFSNTDVVFGFNVYEYDPEAKRYFKAFHSNDAELFGLIQKEGSELMLYVDQDPSTEIQSPQVFMMTIGIMPQDFEQELHLAVSVTDKFVKQWGVGFEPPPDPPSTPTLYSPSNGFSTTDLAPTFDWNNVSGATSYYIQVDNNSNFSSPEISQSTSLSIYTPGSNLAQGTYYWRVRAINSDGSSSYTSAWSVNLGSVPALPTLIAPADSSFMDNTIPIFDWDDVPNATSYTILVDNNSDFTSPFINETVNESTYTPDVCWAETNYYWKVSASNSYGAGSYSSTWTFTLLNFLGSEIQVMIAPLGQILTWNHVVGANGYDVYSSDDPYGTFSFLAHVETTELDISTDLTNSDKRFYQIVAVCN